MKVLHLAAEGDNYIEFGDRRFLVLRSPGRGCHTIPAACPHRGGPLHLGAVEATGQFIVCPWHQTKVSVKRLLRGGLPTVASRGSVTVVLDGTEAAYAYRRQSSVDCAAALANCGRAE